jgi:hypothetical protein
MIGFGRYFPEFSAWYSLSFLAKAFLLLLLLIVIYQLYFALFVLLRLRSLLILEYRIKGLRQMTGTIGYLFGLVFFIQIQNAFWTPDNNQSVGLMIFENFRDDFRLAAFVFLGLLTLHCIQWFVSQRILVALLRLDSGR